MTNYETGAVRDTGGKGRCDLLPTCALIRVSRHMEDALEHYPERNWERGLPMHSMIDSAMRHLFKYVDGWNDEDHLCAATTNLLMAMWTEEKRPDLQDIPTRTPRKAEDDHMDVESSSCKEARDGAEKGQGEKGTCLFCQFHDNLFGNDMGGFICMSTREMDPCSFDGDYTKCLHGKQK